MQPGMITSVRLPPVVIWDMWLPYLVLHAEFMECFPKATLFCTVILSLIAGVSFP